MLIYSPTISVCYVCGVACAVWRVRRAARGVCLCGLWRGAVLAGWLLARLRRPPVLPGLPRFPDSSYHAHTRTHTQRRVAVQHIETTHLRAPHSARSHSLCALRVQETYCTALQTSRHNGACRPRACSLSTSYPSCSGNGQAKDRTSCALGAPRYAAEVRRNAELGTASGTGLTSDVKHRRSDKHSGLPIVSSWR
jgi:hypothetical protein